MAGAVSVNRGAYPQTFGPIMASKFQCTGEEIGLAYCPYSTSFSCGHQQDAGVICPEACYDGQVRLSGNTNHSGYWGRVEVCLLNDWMTVCEDSWDDNDAAVICRLNGSIPRGVDSTH